MDQLVGTFEEWQEANLTDDESPEAANLRQLLDEFRSAVVQRKAALKAAWTAGPPYTVLDELLGRTCRGKDENDEVRVTAAVLMEATETFIEQRKSKDVIPMSRIAPIVDWR